MEGIRAYLLSVTAAAILCAIVKALLGKSGTAATLGRLLCGIFMAVTVLRPWLSLELDGLADYFDDIQYDAQSIVAAGTRLSEETESAVIKERVEAYILDKATRAGAVLEVEVTLNDAKLPVSVRLQGDIGPYDRAQLEQMMTTELGIGKEAQNWIS